MAVTIRAPSSTARASHGRGSSLTLGKEGFAMHRLYHDFNKLMPEREGLTAAPLVCIGTKRDLDELHLTLEEGMQVLLYQFDPDVDGTPAFLEVEAKIRYAPEEKCFMANFVWDDLKHRIDLQARER